VPLASKRCRPCEGDVAPLTTADAERLRSEVPAWNLVEGRLRRRLVFATFVDAMAFVNRVAALAEQEGHHPDFTVHYRQVDFEIWTHAIGGLSENDFILAAKIDGLER
jgi:4a-hydroxytetrahydrobiopterin dehydratase